MRSYSSQTEIRPKVSTMPRQKTEAAAYLNLYKLSVEKKRLQYELETIEQRQQRIQKRLAFLNSQVAELEKSAANLCPEKPIHSLGAVLPRAKQATPESASLNTLFLEY
jgi:chromosome segregation ATPase